MGDLDGKVAYVTGGARGQGRSHALHLAARGADIALFDLCGPSDTQPYDAPSLADLEETAALVEKEGRRVVYGQGDVRDLVAQQRFVGELVSELGGLDIVVANAGIWSYGLSWELTEEQWEEMLAVNVSGVWRTTKATVPVLLEQGRGGSIILISSICGVTGFAGLSHYVAAKHGVVGLTKVLAQEVGPHGIRVNAVCPTNVNTTMFDNPTMRKVFIPEKDEPDEPLFLERAAAIHCLPQPWVEVGDVSEIVGFLASDASRYVTGTNQLIDLGCLAKP